MGIWEILIEIEVIFFEEVKFEKYHLFQHFQLITTSSKNGGKFDNQSQLDHLHKFLLFYGSICLGKISANVLILIDHKTPC